MSVDDEAAEVRELATRGTPIGDRIEGLKAAVEAARGHISDVSLDEALSAAERATGRLRLSAQHTVVAIAGATGSGKSSTFNNLVGLELSSIGVRRPTTSWATAVVWGSEGAGEVLEWLGIPPRHHTMRDSLLDTRREDSSLDGIVLMDLPDHDSTEVSHHLEVDRLVELADLLVWVVDPQKYADAALHDRYLKPLATHQDVMVVVLNHIDTIAEEKRAGMVADVRRLLAADGLP
ncbi:MAG TPA: GTPase, partial [Nocardioides sp.]|nr:GTPase [Nocardioides sp.]